MSGFAQFSGSAVRPKLDQLDEFAASGMKEVRELVFVNPAQMRLRMNPDYFQGTSIASQAAALLPPKLRVAA